MAFDVKWVTIFQYCKQFQVDQNANHANNGITCTKTIRKSRIVKTYVELVLLDHKCKTLMGGTNWQQVVCMTFLKDLKCIIGE